MKLELKHLAPYLPYKLMISQPRLGKNEAYLMYGFKWSEYANEWVVFIDDSKHADYQSSYLKGVKPILRPLSDLTKEIEVNGEKFVPIHLLNIYDPKNVNYNKLLEWHFDVFGLIEKGLAIDINTLEL